ncbi:hypothetical protein [Sulfurospirillum multivorans]|nr:hypothetical protein [Sulfurospirillum multivorans]QEH07289.1 hypothetical protein SMN_2533 [Sulfurospirillum multivorans]
MIFLDFDGVLFNTVKEAYVISMIAKHKYKTIEDIKFTSKHYELFLKYRYLVGPAWNYKYLLELLDTQAINFEKKYKEIIDNALQKDYKVFEKLFFDTREELQTNDLQKWLKLNESYSFLDMIKSLLINKQDEFLIITTKDKATVKKLLEFEGIYLSEKSIYDKEDFAKYKSKATIIQEIMINKKIPYALFLDDNSEHLNECRNILNLQLLQANWGYISPLDTNALSQKQVFNQIMKVVR